jgi:hypothetical protein
MTVSKITFSMFIIVIVVLVLLILILIIVIVLVLIVLVIVIRRAFELAIFDFVTVESVGGDRVFPWTAHELDSGEEADPAGQEDRVGLQGHLPVLTGLVRRLIPISTVETIRRIVDVVKDTGGGDQQRVTLERGFWE